MGDFCAQHIEQVKDTAMIKQTVSDLKTSFDEVRDRMVAHITEGEKQGGVRDRVSKLEWKVESIEARFWIPSIVGGVIGALIGSGSSSVILTFVNWIMHIK